MVYYDLLLCCFWRCVKNREISFCVKGNAVGHSTHNALVWTSFPQEKCYVRSARLVSACSIIHTPTICFKVILQLLTAGFVNIWIGIHSCFACKSLGEDVRRCMLPGCGKFYHGECAASHAPTVPLNRAFRCPLHVCLSCFITNPTNPSVSKGLLCIEQLGARLGDST